MIGLIGKKIGMTRIFTEDGVSIPVTVIEVKEHRITQIRRIEDSNYQNIQVTTGTKKRNHINKPEAGHFIKCGVEVGRGLWEFSVKKSEKYSVGQNININIFSKLKKVDVTGTSKGKGFSGVIKRWNFCSQDTSHGNSLSHRAPGSIGQNQTPGKVFKGKKMAGQLGNERVTIQSLDIIRIDDTSNLLLVKGAVPGASGSDLIIKPAIKV